MFNVVTLVILALLVGSCSGYTEEDPVIPERLPTLVPSYTSAISPTTIDAAQVEWIQRFFSDTVDGLATAADGNGNIYIAVSRGEISPLGSAFIQKYDDAGTEVWTRGWGDSRMLSAHFPLGIAVDAGDIYVVGYTARSIRGLIRGFLTKYDADGNEVWTRVRGNLSQSERTDFTNRACDVAVDSTGIYVSGAIWTGRQGDSATTYRTYLRKFDRKGNEMWQRDLGAKQSIRNIILASGSDGIYIIDRGEVVFTTQGVSPPASGRYIWPVAMLRYDTNGNVLWRKEFSGDSEYGIAVNWNGIFVVSGGSIRLYNAGGDEVWVREFKDFTEAFGIAVDATGVYVAGRGALSGQKGAGGEDVILRKFDIFGTEQWTRQFGTNRNDGKVRLAIDSDAIYALGVATGTSRLQTVSLPQRLSWLN
jgi:hypothetical protein